MIQNFEDTFRDLKIELILGSSLQTAVVSFRVLQKVENIENLLYLGKLDPLKNVGWDSGRTCLRGTRDAIVNDLIQWASITNESGMTNSSQIYVLQGPPGCGKSSIAHSVAQAFDRQKRLGAAIFLDDRTKGTINSSTISSTIASLLAHYDQKIGEQIAEKIKTDVSLAEADIGRQFPDLILSATQDLALVGPVCIIIDGLQKVAGSPEQLRLLTAIADYFKLLPPNFRLLLTCRTPKDIAPLLQNCVTREITFDDEGIIVDFSQYISQSLHKFFSKKPKIAEKYTRTQLHDQLKRRSMGIPFWISTLRQFLLSCTDGDECIILEYILSNKFPRTKEEAMDHLYHAILRCTPYPEAIVAVCHILIQSSNPLPLLDTSTILLASSEHKHASIIGGIMQRLGFVKESGRDSTDTPLFSIYPSLEDFLTNSRRCHGTTFYVDRLSVIPSLAGFCLEHMDKFLKQNICELDDIMTLNEDIPDKENHLHQYIPEMLQYACRNWVFNLESLDDSKQDILSVLQQLEYFLSTHLLHWIECMGLLGWVDVASAYLDRLALWLTKHDNSLGDPRYVLAVNGIRFMHAFAPIISKAAMQTYLSLLPLMPSYSLLFGKYLIANQSNPKSSSHLRIIVDPTTLQGRTDEVNLKVVRTSSGGLIVRFPPSGGAMFFDLESGNEVGSRIECQEFTSSIIVFSPDGLFMAASSMENGSIDIWNIETRRHAKNLTYKSNHPSFTATSISYSMDGTQIMAVDTGPYSPSRGNFYIWDVVTGECIYHLEVNVGWDEIALSPDGSQIAVPNNLGIQLIDVSTGQLSGELVEPQNLRRTWDRCAWSPNGRLFVASQETNLIRLWSLGNLSSKDFMLGDYRTPVYDLVFSPDSSMLIVAHANHLVHSFKEFKNVTLSIWDTHKGILVGEQRIKKISSILSMTFSTGGGKEILIYGLSLSNRILRIRTMPSDLEVYMHHPPKFHPSQTPRTIEYSHYTPGAIREFASQIDADGWIHNTKGERQLLVPQWANYELLSFSKSSTGRERQCKTLEVKGPEKTIVLRYIIPLEPKDITIVCGTS